ncbi:creatininase family protein, partial [Candidatus Bipolaricaulota bacterium]|nr:creatininase family protein [Candidatus Bipolaricaulota bacterium]
TSIMLAVNSNLVDLDKAGVPVCKNLSKELLLNDIRDCRFRNAPIHVGLRTRDYTDTGDMIEHGLFPKADHSIPPTAATAQKGEEIIDAIARYIADFIEEFKSVRLPL